MIMHDLNLSTSREWVNGSRAGDKDIICVQTDEISNLHFTKVIRTPVTTELNQMLYNVSPPFLHSLANASVSSKHTLLYCKIILYIK